MKAQMGIDCESSSSSWLRALGGLGKTYPTSSPAQVSSSLATDGQGRVLDHLPAGAQVLHQVLQYEKGLRHYRIIEDEYGSRTAIGTLRNHPEARAFAPLQQQVEQCISLYAGSPV